jgi:hypothetical protein
MEEIKLENVKLYNHHPYIKAANLLIQSEAKETSRQALA